MFDWKQFSIYLFRWQLSTITLAPCIYYLNPRIGAIFSTIIANFVGGVIFYFVDKYLIFKEGNNASVKIQS